MVEKDMMHESLIIIDEGSRIKYKTTNCFLTLYKLACVLKATLFFLKVVSNLNKLRGDILNINSF